MPPTNFSSRYFARQLGLRYDESEGHTKGRPKFTKDAPTHRLWYSVQNAQINENVSYNGMVRIIDQYGPQVWTASNRHELYEPGENEEYPTALKWPEDKARIVDIFCDLYQARNPLFQRPTQSNMTPAVHDAVKKPPSITSDDMLKEWLSPERLARHKSGINHDVKDLFLTDLWMQNDDGQYGAIINAGEHRTIKELFTAIEDAFSNESAIDIQAVLGHVVKVVLEFSNLGPVSTKPIALSLDDDDRKLQNLRWAIVCGLTTSDRKESARELWL